MPAELLTLVGFHGKLPVTGDFVTRGLPHGFRVYWDRWAARYLVTQEAWPEGGLRLRLASGGRVACGVAVPSRDIAGRRFPLAAFVIAGDLPDPPALDRWADAAHAALTAAQAGGQDAETLWARLAALPVPQGAAGQGAAMQVWRRGQPAQAVDPAAPALTPLFSCSGSSIP